MEDDGIRREYVAQMCRFLEDRQIEQTPLLLIQMQDVLAQLLVSRQIDGALNSGGALGTKLQAAGDGRSRALTLVEAAGKSRERLRRAMKDLSDATKTAGSPAHQSLAEVMKPILKKAQGALEEALGQDARKKTKRRARPKKNEA